MTRQIAIGYGTEHIAFLERRIRVLESSVASLAEAVGVMARGLEGTPARRQDLDEIARSARLTHELLLAAGLVSTPQEKAQR